MMCDAALPVQANPAEIADGGYLSSSAASGRLGRTEPLRPLLPVQNAKAYVAVTVEWGNHDPAVGARVVLTNSVGSVRYGVTDRDGRFKFDKLKKGIYSVTAIRRDDRGQEYFDRTEVTLRNNRAHSTPMLRLQSVIQQPAAQPTGGRGTITFTVKSDRSGPAVSNAEVWLSDVSGDVVAAYRTDEHGRVVFRKLPAGTYTASIRYFGHQTTWRGKLAGRNPRVTPVVHFGGATIDPSAGGPQLTEQKVLTPGIYVAARDLALAPATPELPVGRHQFIVLVPKNPERFRGMLTNLGDGALGIVIATHDVNDRLQVKRTDVSDLLSIREYVNPKQNVHGPARFDTEVAKVKLRGRDIDHTIRRILAATDHYIAYEQRYPIWYPSPLEQFKPGCVNSNSWAQSMIEYIVGKNRVKEDFAGWDLCHGNRISKDYFVP
jgi:hypothetical protein